MNLIYKGKGVVITIVLLFLVSIILLVRSKYYIESSTNAAIFIILDFTVTAPIIYYLVIKNLEIPKISVLSVTIIGIIFAGWVLPVKDQYVLDHIKVVAVPLIEIAILSYLIYVTRHTIRAYRAVGDKAKDFFTVLKISIQKVLPGVIGILLATEVSVIYYGLILWKKPNLKYNEFTYHKKSGILVTMYIFLGLVIIETFVMHYLVHKWNVTIAWVLTFISIYSALQIFALLKSMAQRPFIIDEKNNQLHLRYGFFTETTIVISDIQEVILTSRSFKNTKESKPLSPLGPLDGHNVVIKSKLVQSLQGTYGKNRPYKELYIYVDDKNLFKKRIDGLLHKLIKK